MIIPKLIRNYSLVFLFLGNIQSGPTEFSQQKIFFTQDEYVCTPCGSDCDKELYSGPGKCKHCGMALVKKSTVHFKTIQPEDLCKYIETHPNVVLLDVRTKEEFEGTANPNFGTLKNANNVPIQVLERTVAHYTSAYKDKRSLSSCLHSHRSLRASYGILTQNGFTNITNMAGG
jgi:rhodanese-related sulfurtransferase